MVQCISSPSVKITIQSYELLLLKIKALQENFTHDDELNISSEFLQILDDCSNCIIQVSNFILISIFFYGIVG